MTKHLLGFASEWHWTPAQVWALELWQLVEFCSFLDKLAAAKRKASARKGR